MDVAAAWAKIGSQTKTAREVSGDWINSTLDELAPPFVPFAAWWDQEADRRRQLRTPDNLKALLDAQRKHNSARATAASAKAQQATARNGSRNPLNGARRAAAKSVRGAREQQRNARAELRKAQANYPTTLAVRAAQVHAAHGVPAAVATAALGSPWPVSASAAAVALQVGGLFLGRRRVTVCLPDDLSAEERQLVARLDPSHWVQHADDRGLGGTVTTPAEVTPGGIRCEVRLDGTWTVKGLNDRMESVRALLGARTGLRIRATSGQRGGWAVLTLSTRSAAEGVSSLWTPDRIPADPLVMSLGLDTETGDEVLVPFDERLLVSGASGTGKSWSTRPLLGAAHLRGDLVLIDGKGEEANIWEPICRTAVERDEVEDVVDQAHAEMTRRKRDMKARRISVWDGPQLTVLVDEGQVVLAMISNDKERLQRLIELSSLGRSRGVVLWWATQYPITDGSAPGVHKLIAPNLLTRFSLRVAGTTQAQVALDDCAHYAPQQIPADRAHRGHGYLKGYGPRMIRTWTLDDAGVSALPPKAWEFGGRAEVPAPAPDPAERPALQLLKGGDFLLAPPAAPAEAEVEPAKLPGGKHREPVLRAVAAGSTSVTAVAKATGINKGNVSRTVAALIDAGELHKAADGTLTTTSTEETA